VSEIDDVLLVLSDGAWHDLSEIEHALQIGKAELLKIVELLKEFNFVRIKGRRVSIDTDTKNLLGPAGSHFGKQ
jgi:predicted transcriptional regulator